MTDSVAPSAPSAPASSATTSATPASTSSTTSASSTPASSASSTKETPTSAESTSAASGTSPAAEAVRKLKVKIDNEEHELDESEVIKGYQRSTAANKRFEEASKMRQQAERFIDALQKDPISILQNPALGVNFREVAEKYLLAQLEDEMLSPDEKKSRSEQEELRKYREQENTTKQQREMQAVEQMKQKYAQEYTEKFQQALESVSLPKTDYTIKRMATYLQEAVKKGYDVDMKDVAELVKEDFYSEQRALYGSLDGDRLISMLGEDVAKKIRQADLAKVQHQPPSFAAPLQTSQQRQSDRQKKESLIGWRDRILSGI